MEDEDSEQVQQASVQTVGFEQPEDASFLLVERVKEFIVEFYKQLVNNDTYKLRTSYYEGWMELTDEYYKDTEWPAPEDIADLVDKHEVFLLCYTELYYRHIFLNGKPLLHHRIYSFENYVNLFSVFLDETVSADLRLPLEWLADMLDEFLYQFEDFCSFKQQLQSLTEEDIDELEENKEVFDIAQVIQILSSFVAAAETSDPEKKFINTNNSNQLSLVQTMGYLSILSLSRIQVLLGDYRLALTELKPIDLDEKRSLFSRLNSTHTTLFYYTGFAYMMLKRYSDAVNIFSAILLMHGRGVRIRNTCYADSQFPRKYERIRSLCALCIALAPGLTVDEQIRGILTEKNAELMSSLVKRDMKIYQEVFVKSCPRFITPSQPDFKNLVNREKETSDIQLKWFMREVKTQENLPEMRSFLKLYSSISVEKLSALSNISVDNLLKSLVSIKYKAHQYVRSSEPQILNGVYDHLNGAFESVSDLHFFVENNMIHVDEKQRKQKFADYFLQNTMRLQQCIGDLKSNQPRKRYVRNNNKGTSKK